eukprot:TRINITY_DN60850_c0_g2_i7.p1 TRINITY_DN60850_c0_g2~~TRINITY_DN60850_c0_g2_i7.p1  ORF type:complete len:557 (+),score=19.04 TRINITY_DN60850_c0_g2_i7:68-1738(+)
MAPWRVAPARDSQRHSEFSTDIETQLQDELEIAEFLQQLAESSRKVAWSHPLGADQHGAWRVATRIFDAAFTEALLPLVFMLAVLQASIILLWCAALFLLSEQELAYRVFYWCTIFAVIVALFRQVDLTAWGHSPRLWLCLFLLLGVLLGLLRAYIDLVDDFVAASAGTAPCGWRVWDIPLPFLFTGLYPGARFIAACYFRRRRLAGRACWQMLGTLLGGIPFLAAHALMVASEFTSALDVPLVAGICIMGWSLLGIPLQTIGKFCWSRLSPRQSLLLTIMWVSWAELAYSTLGLLVWIRKPAWALGHAFSFSIIVATNVIRGRMCLWAMSEPAALMQRLTLHFQVFAAMFGRISAYILFACFLIVRHVPRNSDDEWDELKRLDVYEGADVGLADLPVPVFGVVLIVCVYIGYLVCLPFVWCPAVQAARVVPSQGRSSTSVSEDVILGVQCADAAYAATVVPESSVRRGAWQDARRPDACTLWREGDKKEMAREQNRLLAVFLKRYMGYLLCSAAFIFIQASLLKLLLDGLRVWMDLEMCAEGGSNHGSFSAGRDL